MAKSMLPKGPSPPGSPRHPGRPEVLIFGGHLEEGPGSRLPPAWPPCVARGPRKNVCGTGYSQAVTHPSTNPARRCLTSVIGREPVFSTWCGRRREGQAGRPWSVLPGGRETGQRTEFGGCLSRVASSSFFSQGENFAGSSLCSRPRPRPPASKWPSGRLPGDRGGGDRGEEVEGSDLRPQVARAGRWAALSN